jgi:hypothetical protein
MIHIIKGNLCHFVEENNRKEIINHNMKANTQERIAVEGTDMATCIETEAE